MANKRPPRLSEQTINTEPRPVSPEQVDAVLKTSDPLNVKMEKLAEMRSAHSNWVNRQSETDGKPFLRYIDDAITWLNENGKLEKSTRRRFQQ